MKRSVSLTCWHINTGGTTPPTAPCFKTLLIPKHYLFCNAHTQSDNSVRKGTDKNRLKAVQQQHGKSLGRSQEPTEWFLFLWLRAWKGGKPWKAFSGRTLQLTHTHVLNLLATYASIPWSNCSLLGQRREDLRARQEIKDVFCNWFIWVRLPGLISLLTICITEEVRGPDGGFHMPGPIHVQLKSHPHNTHQLPFVQMCQVRAEGGRSESIPAAENTEQQSQTPAAA